jgi:transposase
VEKAFLEQCLAKGLSLREIGQLVDRDPSTVGYWLRKYSLQAAHHDAFSARGPIAEESLQALIDEGASLREMSEELGRGVSSVRYWLKKYGLEPTRLGRRRARTARWREAGMERLVQDCPRHGRSLFVLEGRGYYRCVRCRTDAVANWRRRAKKRLVDGAGGHCALCGYDTYQGALQFHHLDPATKRFPISGGGVTRSFGEILREAENCVLLCANCHAEVEAGVAVVPDSGR